MPINRLSLAFKQPVAQAEPIVLRSGLMQALGLQNGINRFTSTAFTLQAALIALLVIQAMCGCLDYTG
jgi:hypothetical protein